MFHSYTIKQLKPLSLGLDDFFNFAENYPCEEAESTFPKYNILKPTENTYRIEIALAGYNKKDIEIIHKDGVLTVSYSKTKSMPDKAVKEPTTIYQGLTKKSFTKNFAIADTIVVMGAFFIDGILQIDMEEILPEEKKAKRIEIK